jgi:hypothetical protein
VCRVWAQEKSDGGDDRRSRRTLIERIVRSRVRGGDVNTRGQHSNNNTKILPNGYKNIIQSRLQKI